MSAHRAVHHELRQRLNSPRRKLVGGLAFWTGISVSQADATQLDFTLRKHENNRNTPTLLIIGGIQGDEPGVFNAASLIVTDYQIEHGNVWVIPNLNFESIVHRSRGVHGDMNRKFLALPENDPEYETVSKVKRIIRNQQVDVILNLHDGRGYYRPEHEDSLHSPNRWGPSVMIIDQAKVEKPPMAIFSGLPNGLSTGLMTICYRQAIVIT